MALTGFEIMVAVLQAYVFTVLTCLYFKRCHSFALRITQSNLLITNKKRRNKIMEAEAAKFIGAGLAVIALAGVGIGIGNIFSSLVSSIARNPAARGEVFGIGILGFALTEAIALFALLISFLLLFAV